MAAKPITVTAKHVSVVYGEAIPALDFDVPTLVNGDTKGTTATTFSPNETCTRGQIVTFLYRTLEK